MSHRVGIHANMRLHLAYAYSCKKTQCYEITEEHVEVEEQNLKCALKNKNKIPLQQRRLMRDFECAPFSQECFAGFDLGPSGLKRLSADDTSSR